MVNGIDEYLAGLKGRLVALETPSEEHRFYVGIVRTINDTYVVLGEHEAYNTISGFKSGKLRLRRDLAAKLEKGGNMDVVSGPVIGLGEGVILTPLKPVRRVSVDGQNHADE